MDRQFPKTPLLEQLETMHSNQSWLYASLPEFWKKWCGMILIFPNSNYITKQNKKWPNKTNFEKMSITQSINDFHTKSSPDTLNRLYSIIWSPDIDNCCQGRDRRIDWKKWISRKIGLENRVWLTVESEQTIHIGVIYIVLLWGISTLAIVKSTNW